MGERLTFSTIQGNGWALISAEERAAAAPTTFHIPSLAARTSLSPRDAVRLLFDIETKENGRIIDRGVDRMWVIVKTKTDDGYIGILDSDPGTAENLTLHERHFLAFSSEHIADINQPPRDYIAEKYGLSFLKVDSKLSVQHRSPRFC